MWNYNPVRESLTNSVNFTITNETIGFVFNGPNIISETKTAIEDTNHGINFNVISQRIIQGWRECQNQHALKAQ